jgi:hypothetical protein
VPALRQLYNQEYRYDVFHEEYVDEFSDWEQQSGGKGCLVAADIDRLMEDPNLHGDAAATLATLKEMLRSGILPGQTLLFLPNAIHRILTDGTRLKANFLFNHRLVLSDTWKQKKAILAHSVRDLFENGIPDWQAVTQSGAAPCYLEACLVACTRQNLYGIVDMVTQEQDAFTVRFASGMSVSIPPPTDAQLMILANSGADGCWASVVDKAWQKLSGPSMSALTGRPSRMVPAPRDGEGFRDLLQLETLQGGAVVVQIGDQHHPLLAYEDSSDTVTLRYPWDEAGALTSQPLSNLVDQIQRVEADLLS